MAGTACVNMPSTPPSSSIFSFQGELGQHGVGFGLDGGRVRRGRLRGRGHAETEQDSNQTGDAQWRKRWSGGLLCGSHIGEKATAFGLSMYTLPLPAGSACFRGAHRPSSEPEPARIGSGPARRGELRPPMNPAPAAPTEAGCPRSRFWDLGYHNPQPPPFIGSGAQRSRKPALSRAEGNLRFGVLAKGWEPSTLNRSYSSGVGTARLRESSSRSPSVPAGRCR